MSKNINNQEQGNHPACAGCGGPHPYDTAIPSPTWNDVVRVSGLPDYLCMTCIVVAFAKAGRGFTASLWSPELNGLHIAFTVDGAPPADMAGLQRENNILRTAMREIYQHGRDTLDSVCRPIPVSN